MNIKCALGFHTGLINSRCQFKAYNNVEDPLIADGTVLTGHGNITAYYHKSCGNCGKDLGEQSFCMGWYPDHYTTLPHTLEECIEKARAFQSNKG